MREDQLDPELKNVVQAAYYIPGGVQFYIRTPEGDMNLNYGDWIIRGTKGEYYPCMDDVFRVKYEEAEDA